MIQIYFLWEEVSAQRAARDKLSAMIQGWGLMLIFNILPKAKLVTEEFLVKKRKLSNNPFVIAYDKLTTSSLIALR